MFVRLFSQGCMFIGLYLHLVILKKHIYVYKLVFTSLYSWDVLMKCIL